MHTRLASFVPWIAAATLLFAVAWAGSASGDEPAAAPAPLPPDSSVSDPLALAPDGDEPASDGPVLEPGDTPPPTDPTPLDPPPLLAVIEQLAPIVQVDLAIAESYPPQYFVGVTSAQPDGCHRFSRFDVARNGTAIEISVFNTVPKDLAVVLCLALYGETQSNVPLGSDFVPGESYTVSVNGEQQLSFVAQ